MADEAALREDGLNISTEINFARPIRAGSEEEESEERCHGRALSPRRATILRESGRDGSAQS